MFLNFSTYYEFHASGSGKVEVNVSGTTTQVGSTLSGSSTGWETVSINISSYWNDNVTIEFLFDSAFSTSSDYYWLVDAVSIDRFVWDETAEPNDGSLFGAGSTTDWTLESWELQCAYTGSGDNWIQTTVGSDNVWSCDFSAGLNDALLTTSVYIPSLMGSVFADSDLFKPVIYIDVDYNFGQSGDIALLEITTAGSQDWFELHSFTGSTTGWETKEIDIPPSYTGQEVVSRLRVVTGQNPNTGVGSEFNVTEFLFGTDNGGGFNNAPAGGVNLLKAAIDFQSNTAVPADVTVSKVKNGAIYIGNNQNKASFNLEFDFKENKNKVLYYDRYKYEYQVTYLDALMNEDVGPCVGPVFGKEIDEKKKKDDFNAVPYTSSGTKLQFTVNCNTFRTNDYQMLKVHFKVTSRRGVWSNGNGAELNPTITQYAEDWDEGWFTWNVYYISANTVIDTDIYLETMQSGFTVTPQATGNQWSYQENDAWVWKKGTTITLQIDVLLEEFSNSRDNYDFDYQVHVDTDKDQEMGDETLYASGVAFEWDDRRTPFVTQTHPDDYDPPDDIDPAHETFTLTLNNQSGWVWYIVRCRIDRDTDWWPCQGGGDRSAAQSAWVGVCLWIHQAP
jgi:hypothetical protein